MRFIDDVIEFVKNHPHIPPTQKQIIITRLDLVPSQKEIDNATELVNRLERDG